MPADIDPRLRKALKDAKPGSSVQAVVTFGREDGELLSRETTDEIIQQIVEHARKKSAKTPKRMKVFYNLQTLAIEADPDFVKSLIAEDAVTSAMLNAKVPHKAD